MSTFTFKRLSIHNKAEDKEEESKDDDLQRQFLPQTCRINLSIFPNNSNMVTLGKINLIINGEENSMTAMCVPIIASEPKKSARVASIVSPMKK